MALPPDKSKPFDAKPGTAAARDFFLDPLPVPEATESNTDTAWGLWEHTLRAHELDAQQDAPTDFQDTVDAGTQPPPKKP